MKTEITLKKIKDATVIAIITFMAILAYLTSCACLAIATDIEVLTAANVLVMVYFLSCAGVSCLVIIALVWLFVKPIFARREWRKLQEGPRPGDAILS